MSETGKLYIVATPIGNLGDITLRALQTLTDADAILCEDTRTTQKLLAHFNIKKQLISYHQHSESNKVDRIISLLGEGKNLALVTDAGTPGISDPGNKLIASVIASNVIPAKAGIQKSSMMDSRRSLPHTAIGGGNDNVVPIPGPSAVITALSISGFPTDKFIFLGFPPHKKGRQTFFKEVAESKYTVVFYESSHRIKKCLDELKRVFSTERFLASTRNEVNICVCRELTKKFETIYRGNIHEILEMNISEKGEFVVVISNS